MALFIAASLDFYFFYCLEKGKMGMKMMGSWLVN